MNKKNVVGYVVASAAAFGLGYVVQPTQTVAVPLASTTKTVVEVVRPVPVPTHVDLLGFVPPPIEREPTPHPTDCLVMRWTR